MVLRNKERETNNYISEHTGFQNLMKTINWTFFLWRNSSTQA